MKITHLLLATLALGMAVPASAEKLFDWTSSGTYTVGKSASVTIPSSGDDVYLKVSGLKVGSSYTFVANGSDLVNIDVVYIYKDEEGDLTDDYLGMGDSDLKTARQARCIVTADDWSSAIEWAGSKDKIQGCFICVSGDEGATISVTSMSGAVSESIPKGDVDNPLTITPGTTPATVSASYVDEAYYFTVASAKTGKYLFTTTKGTASVPVSLAFDRGSASNTVTDVSSDVASEGNVAYLVTVTKAGTLNFHVAGAGASFGLTYQYASSGTLGKLTVNMKGADGTWSVKGASGSYAGGTTIGILGQQTVVFGKVTGFSTPENVVVTPTEAEPAVTVTGVYNDTYDPKDDVVSGATKLSVSAKASSAARTLFADDAADHFAFTAKDGVYYNFALEDLEGDAVMTVFAKATPSKALADPAVRLSKLTFAAGDYIVKVAHAEAAAPVDAQYSLAASSASVGTVAFAKTAVSAKKSAGTVTLSVTRSSSEGKVRVLYGTESGTAQPGVDYVAQNGELVWENGDKAAKTITVRLIPEAFATTAISRTFDVALKAVDAEDLGEDEYPAVFTSGKDVATVTVTEAAGKAATAVKAATVKTETVPLETGTYQGVIAEDGSALTNGFPALAAVTFTAKNATTKALSAKVTLGGKTYTFSADTWDDETDESTAVATLTQNLTVNKVTYTNTLRLEVVRGATANAGDWAKARAYVALLMNVPDANGKGVQEDILYTGELYRDNAKVQDYLYAMTNAVGYYTVALAPSGILPGDGVPAGNGYLTMTIDNKGKAKIAGLLADGSTKPSYASVVAVADDGATLYVPVFVAKSPYCFGGTLALYRDEDGRYVVDSSASLLWNNDNALLTYDGEEGWSIALDPVGGYFNTVENLQAHYLTCDLSVSTVGTGDLLAEACASGYDYVADAQADGYAVTLAGNTLSTEKRALVKDGKLYDLAASVNPCNVQVKLARATGIVTGTFSVWTANEDGTAQKEISGLKHYGIMILSRDEYAPIDDDILTAGFFTQTAKVSYEVESGTKTVTKTRSYTASNPFNILAVDQGEPDWYDEDWGTDPED